MTGTNPEPLMRRLADARPADFDPELPVPAETRAAELRRAMTAPTASSAPAAAPRGPRWRPYALGGGLVATATATVLLVISATAGSGPAAQPAHWDLDAAAPQAGGDGDSVLLAAAETAVAQDAARDGRYWSVDYELWQQFAASESAERYTIAGGVRQTNSTDTKTGEFCSSGKNIPFAPASAADNDAWQRDGSPDPVPVTMDSDTQRLRAFMTSPGKAVPLGEDGNSAFHVYRGTAPPTVRVYVPTTDEAPFILGGRALSLEELNALPADPDALTDELLRGFTGEVRKWAGSREEFLFEAARNLLLDVPVSGEVRGAAFQMLAGLEGITVLDDVTDVAGRTGTAAALESRADSGAMLQHRLIFDSATSRGLTADTVVVEPTGSFKDYKAGAVVSAEAVEQAEWTDTRPVKPCPKPALPDLPDQQ
ncbi:CU044_5270 family protein [Streptomyces sp. WMMC500]|uniref:CU044_5270 family protein n=1 Tax=Streptomyces sp. WMMC500 TaxID=3015154 RepID=UPI00248CDE27|nr:CU044_5270 family protein [Streptomyces sp. WMMC500]WBB63547.1 CU044_5270 family protein [Streptomyces sp. WMMC500]